MPWYDYKCALCAREYEAFNKIVDRQSERCDCGGVADVQISTGRSASSVRAFQPGIFEDITGEPLYIESAQQLRDVCEKAGKTSSYLENGPFKTNPGERHKRQDKDGTRYPDYYKDRVAVTNRQAPKTRIHQNRSHDG